jgi:signal transduction histidine kinase/DNA-binding response OmpR family regulator
MSEPRGATSNLNTARPLLTVSVRYEHDVVLARQRARQIGEILGFGQHDQVRIATAVSEITRNAFLYATNATAEFSLLAQQPAGLEIRISDRGPGIPNLEQILAGQYISTTGMGMGILGARRLMDRFEIESTPDGTTVWLVKHLPPLSVESSRDAAATVAEKLMRQAPQGAMEELQHQNQELITTLGELEKRQSELAQLNKELEDTNRGVVALYAELDERADYLRRASELKTQFLSNMTHEFRTPLNSILSISRLLLDRVDGELSREQERQVKFIQKGANDLSELVNDLLDLAKVEAGKIKVRPIEFTVSTLFGALRGMLRPLLAHNSSVDLVFEEPSGFPELQTDESKVSQILRNLISNALKFTPSGEVRVRAWFDHHDARAVFAVSDTGIGIALGDQERIFQEFSQVEGAHQAGKRGTGLGLSLSRKLAELLGGTLTVQSELGAGSTFVLRLPPQYSGPTEVSIAPEMTTEIDPVRRPVLVVEDNRETLFVYEKYFKGTGFQPVPARTVRQAQQILERCRPVAVILDVLLSHENTWAFLMELKRQESTRDLPVLVVTVIENQQRAMALGADDFHSKPIDRQWLLSRLNELAGATPEEVLVIDDDEASRYILRGFLGETRFQVVEAASGHEGLRLAREHKPSAIFLDLVMPDLQGAEVLELLKNDPETRHLPVILHTDKILGDDERSGLTASCVAIIPKNHVNRAVSQKLIHEALVQATSNMPGTQQGNQDPETRSE